MAIKGTCISARCLVQFLLALTIGSGLAACSSGAEERETDPRGTPPSGQPESELIDKALDQDVNIPDADVDVDIKDEAPE